MNKTISDSAFCFTHDWTVHLPGWERDYASSVWLARSKRGEWAPFCKSIGERSPALWKRSDISAWFYLKWSVTSPSSYQALIDNGFPEVELPKPKLWPPRRRKKSKKRSDRLSEGAA